MRVYLAGPPFADEYRRRASELLHAAGHEPVDPMRRDYRGATEGHEPEIVGGDLADIEGCDAVLADFGEADEGTSMEAWYAHSRGIPVVVWTQGRTPHPWTVYASRSRHERLEDAVEALEPAGVGPRFTDELRHAAAALWQSQLDHPFVRGVADGSLAPESFRHFLRQDYLFLHAYAAAIQAAAGCSPSEEVSERFAWIAGSALAQELELQRELAGDWGVSAAELEGAPPTPTTRAYGEFLLGSAQRGAFPELVAALLPCFWGYSELGQRLAERPPSPEARYVRWIAHYASDEFARSAEWARKVVDDAAAESAAPTRARMREAFLESSRHELAFWEASWKLE